MNMFAEQLENGVPSERSRREISGPSYAINVFLRQAVYEHRVPFDIRREAPNADTVAAMQEAEEMSKNPDNPGANTHVG